MGKIENIAIFQDTEKHIKHNKILNDAVKNSMKSQIVIPEYMAVSELFSVDDEVIYEKDADIIISKKRSYEAAFSYKGMQTCVHNFASASNPGGGVAKGSSAQEECLCRCSTLYFNLNTSDMWAGFYSPHRAMKDPIHNDDCIYTPEVVVFKTDTAVPKIMPEDEWYRVNVITCAAPNLRVKPSNQMNVGDGDENIKITDEELYNIHVKRLTRILDIAVATRNEVIVLGAFGCGAFENNPEVVARASRDVVKKYMRCFRKIEFAIYCSDRNELNYEIFKRTIQI